MATIDVHGFATWLSFAHGLGSHESAGRIHVTGMGMSVWGVHGKGTLGIKTITSAHTRLLQSLLPPGRAWPREKQAVMTRFVDGLAKELSRVDDRVAQLLLEADPAQAEELLPEWEALTGSLAGPGDSIEDRRAAVAWKLLSRGRHDPGFFVSLAATLGYTITIDYIEPARSGSARCGQRLYGSGWVFVWRVSTPSGGSNTLLEEALRSAAPAHTVVHFHYV